MRLMTGDWKEALGMLISIIIFFGIMVITGYITDKIEQKKIKKGKLFYGGYEG